ncbi:hypothetical protein ACQFX9_06280 [Aliinostoc sp. HNIBRCY26]|uniref:hypothetical protein n=1 Tax=Aliinostoc sp. HNIBRCY26 TaxID=3418997 RepID=UPI003D044E23
MQAIEKNLFTEISAEESAHVNGGDFISLVSAGAVASVLDAFNLATTGVGQTAILLTLGGAFSFKV